VRRAADEHWEDLSTPGEEEVDLRGLGVVDLAQAVRQGIAPRLGGELGLHVLEVMAAIEESAQLGSTVTITSRAPGRSLLLSDA
jgi:predicted dehydrogenase